MNKYYEKFIKDNEDIFLLVANKFAETGSLRKMMLGHPINQRLKLDFDKKNEAIIELNSNTVLVTIGLKDTHVTILWSLDKENISYNELNKFDINSFFKKPSNIIFRNESEIILSNQKKETSIINLNEAIIFERTVVSKLQLDSNNTTLSIRYTSKTDGKKYEGSHEFTLDSNLNTEHTTKGRYKDQNVENEFLILTKLKEIKEKFNYIEDITDYLFLGKEIPSEIEDILPLSIDMDKEYLKVHKDYKINIDDFRNEYLKIKEKQDLKVKNRMKTHAKY